MKKAEGTDATRSSLKAKSDVRPRYNRTSRRDHSESGPTYTKLVQAPARGTLRSHLSGTGNVQGRFPSRKESRLAHTCSPMCRSLSGFHVPNF